MEDSPKMRTRSDTDEEGDNSSSSSSAEEFYDVVVVDPDCDTSSQGVVEVVEVGGAAWGGSGEEEDYDEVDLPESIAETGDRIFVPREEAGACDHPAYLGPGRETQVSSRWAMAAPPDDGELGSSPSEWAGGLLWSHPMANVSPPLDEDGGHNVSMSDGDPALETHLTSLRSLMDMAGCGDMEHHPSGDPSAPAPPPPRPQFHPPSSEALARALGVNRADLDVDALGPARFFLIKSFTEDDVHKGIKHGVWASTPKGNRTLDRVWREYCGGCGGRVFLLFSVNKSRQFCGVAEMVSGVDLDAALGCWTTERWKGVMRLRWHMIKDVSRGHFEGVRNHLNEGKVAFVGRDTQEVAPEAGFEVLRIMHRHQHATSLLDDFAFYDELEARGGCSRSVVPAGGGGGGAAGGGGGEPRDLSVSGPRGQRLHPGSTAGPSASSRPNGPHGDQAPQDAWGGWFGPPPPPPHQEYQGARLRGATNEKRGPPHENARRRAREWAGPAGQQRGGARGPDGDQALPPPQEARVRLLTRPPSLPPGAPPPPWLAHRPQQIAGGSLEARARLEGGGGGGGGGGGAAAQDPAFLEGYMQGFDKGVNSAPPPLPFAHWQPRGGGRGQRAAGAGARKAASRLGAAPGGAAGVVPFGLPGPFGGAMVRGVPAPPGGLPGAGATAPQGIPVRPGPGVPGGTGPGPGPGYAPPPGAPPGGVWIPMALPSGMPPGVFEGLVAGMAAGGLQPHHQWGPPRAGRSKGRPGAGAEKNMERATMAAAAASVGLRVPPRASKDKGRTYSENVERARAYRAKGELKAAIRREDHPSGGGARGAEVEG